MSRSCSRLSISYCAWPLLVFSVCRTRTLVQPTPFAPFTSNSVSSPIYKIRDGSFSFVRGGEGDEACQRSCGVQEATRTCTACRLAARSAMRKTSLSGFCAPSSPAVTTTLKQPSIPCLDNRLRISSAGTLLFL